MKRFSGHGTRSRQHKAAPAVDIDELPAQAAGVALGQIDGLAAQGVRPRGAVCAVGMQAVVGFGHGVFWRPVGWRLLRGGYWVSCRLVGVLWYSIEYLSMVLRFSNEYF